MRNLRRGLGIWFLINLWVLLDIGVRLMSVKNLPRMTVLGVLDHVGLGLDVGGDRSGDHWVILAIMNDILGR